MENNSLKKPVGQQITNRPRTYNWQLTNRLPIGYQVGCLTVDCWPAVDCWPTVNRLAKANWWSVGSLSVIRPWSHFGISLKVQITNHKHALKAASDTDVSPFSQLKTQWVRKGRRYCVTFAFNCPSYFVFVNSPPSLYFVPKCTPKCIEARLVSQLT